MWERVYQPLSIPQALEVLARHGSQARIVAGGTDVLVELQRGVKPTGALIDVTALRDLRYVSRGEDAIAIGGLATHNDVLNSPLCREFALPLVQACAEVGAPQIRTRATIAGNIVTASPANDTIVALVALGAQVVLLSSRGERRVDLEEFFTGFRATVVQPDELIREIRVRPVQRAERALFLKLGLRRAQAISVISVAIVAAFEGETVSRASIALGCVAPTVVRASAAEKTLAGRALDERAIAACAQAACEEIAPIDDVRGSAAYRLRAVDALLRRGLERIASDRCEDDLADRPVLLDTGDEELLDVAPFDGTVVARVNGTRTEMRGSENLTLLNALRDCAGLTGSKEGCAEGECGACTVWLDGKAVMSCLVPAAQAHGRNVVTIEGLAASETLHPLQQAYVNCGAVQCGFCIPGMLMAGAKVLEEVPDADLAQLQSAISGNICRCTGYRKILDAMRSCTHAHEEEALA
ncbi:MAG TPA: FAD binding domain-containing protein [Candidatus Baltobacteraceae bacterium]